MITAHQIYTVLQYDDYDHDMQLIICVNGSGSMNDSNIQLQHKLADTFLYKH